jgi:2'-5' RNA ligase
MRLFIALEFPRMNDYFRKIQNQIDPNNGRFSFVDSFHLTLKFLGDVKKEEIHNIIDSLKKISFDKFSFNFDNIGFFENKFGIKVIWQGITPTENIIELNRLINQSPNHPKGWGMKSFNKPHGTLSLNYSLKLGLTQLRQARGIIH